MNYTSFIIKILNKPHYTLYEQKIPFTEALGKFYQFQDNSHTICKLSFWGRSAYEILKSNTKVVTIYFNECRMSKKSCQFLCSKYAKKICQAFLDMQYGYLILVYSALHWQEYGLNGKVSPSRLYPMKR